MRKNWKCTYKKYCSQKKKRTRQFGFVFIANLDSSKIFIKIKKKDEKV